MSSIGNQVIQSYKLELDRAIYIVDEKMNEMKRIALEQSLNSDLQLLLPMKNVDSQSRIALWQLQRRLKDYCVSNSYISDIVIGFNDADVAISNRSIYSIKDVSDIVLDGAILPELQKRAYKNEFLILEKKQSDNSEVPQIVYLLSLPLQSGSKNNAFVLITMSTDALAKMLPADENRVVLLSGSNKSIYINNQPFGFQFNAHDFRLFTTVSSSGDFQYSYYVSNKEFFSKVNNINTMTIIALVFCALLFAMLMLLFMRLNYNPINRMMKKINEQLKSKSISAKNELACLEGSLSNIFNERQNLIGEIDKQSYALKNYFILRLIKGEMHDDAAIVLHNAKYGLASKHDAIVVVVTKLKEYSSLSGKEDTGSNALKRAQFLTVKTFEELSDSTHEISSIDVDDTVVTIINFNVQALEALNERLGELGSTLHTLAGLDVSIATSQCISSLMDAGIAYNQALEAIEYCQLFDKSYAVYSKGVSQNNPNSSKHMMETNKKLGNCIGVGDFEVALSMLDEVFMVNFSQSDSVSAIRMNIYGLIHLVSSALNSFAASGYMQLDTDGIVYRLTSCKSINVLKKLLAEQLSAIYSELKENQERQIGGLIEKVTEYIQLNYQNYNLSVNSIADKFNLSVPYLSRAFKKERSTGLLDHIHSVRIRESKRLIATGQHTINDIAGMVGFNDSSAFIKVFKKSEGIPPGKYTKHQAI